jgi:hypothetical protein
MATRLRISKAKRNRYAVGFVMHRALGAYGLNKRPATRKADNLLY